MKRWMDIKLTLKSKKEERIKARIKRKRKKRKIVMETL
jgi:uridine kinase